MNKHILLGVDVNVSPLTLHALHAASKVLAESSPHLSIALINVVPRPYVALATLGALFVKGLFPLSITVEQRTEAEHALWRARQELQIQGIAPERIEVLIREGDIIEEMLKVASELQVDLIIVGARENSFTQKLRRFFTGSTSRLLSQFARCPVMIVVPPRSQ